MRPSRNKATGRHIDRQTDSEADGQRDKQAARQADRQMDRYIDMRMRKALKSNKKTRVNSSKNQCQFYPCVFYMFLHVPWGVCLCAHGSSEFRPFC